MRVGFIGLGTMGKNAAANIRRKGFEMVVFDIRPEAAAPLVAMGATAAVSPAEVRAAQRLAFSQLRLVVEPGGAAALAAALAGKVPLDSDTVLMLTGGNVDPAAYAATISRH